MSSSLTIARATSRTFAGTILLRPATCPTLHHPAQALARVAKRSSSMTWNQEDARHPACAWRRLTDPNAHLPLSFTTSASSRTTIRTPCVTTRPAPQTPENSTRQPPLTLIAIKRYFQPEACNSGELAGPAASRNRRSWSLRQTTRPPTRSLPRCLRLLRCQCGDGWTFERDIQ